MKAPVPSPGVELSRRNVLSMLGIAAGGVVLAGCRSGSGGPHGAAEFHVAVPYDAPPKGHFNLLTPLGAISLNWLGDFILLPGAMYKWSSQTYYHLLADESTALSADGRTLTYRVRQGLVWSDGKPITAADVRTTWRLRQVLGHSAFTYVDSFRQTDTHTVEFTLKQPAPIVEYWLLRGQIVSDAVYGSFARQADALFAAGKKALDPEMAHLAQQIAAFRPSRVTASGPFNFDYSSITNAQLKLVRNKTGYRSDKVAFDSFTIYNGETDVVTPLVLAKRIDYCTHGFPVATVKQFQREKIRVLRPPVYNGPALYFNSDKHPEFKDKRVRQALAYALDRDQAAVIALGQSAKGVKSLVGFSDLQIPVWMTDAGQKKLTDYAHDPAKAAQLLTEAGWKKEGAHWVTPSGGTASYEILFPQLPEYEAVTQNTVDQMRAFGIQLTMRAENNTVLPKDIGSGNFAMAMWVWGTASNPFPTDPLNTAFILFNSGAQKPNKGIDFPLVQNTASVGQIDLAQAVPATAVGRTPAELKNKVTEVALAFNELLPILPVYERYGGCPVLSKDIKGFPADGDPIYRNSMYADSFVTILTLDGTLKPA